MSTKEMPKQVDTIKCSFFPSDLAYQSQFSYPEACLICVIIKINTQIDVEGNAVKVKFVLQLHETSFGQKG